MVSMRSSDVTPWHHGVLGAAGPAVPPTPPLAATLADQVWGSDEIVAPLD
jgi:hypothetical protein